MATGFVLPTSILLLRQMPPVKSLTQHRPDHRLATDIQRLSFTIQLLEHRRCEIHVDSLHGWPDNRKLIREVRRHVLASIRPLGDLLSIQRLVRCSRHTLSLPCFVAFDKS